MTTLLLAVTVLLLPLQLHSLTAQPNILFILLDDLGWNDVSFHGGSDFETPNIDKYADDGLKLMNYYVQHYCTPTRSALMSGRYPMHDGLQEYIIRSMAPYGMPLEITTLPEQLQAAGYKTHLLGKWHLGFYSPSYTPTCRGFDTFLGYYGDKEEYYMKNNSEWGYVMDLDTLIKMSGIDFRDGVNPSFSNQYSTYLYGNETINKFMDYVTNPDSDPLFILLSAQAAHSPYDAPDEYKKRFNYIDDDDRAELAAVIAAFDDSLGQIFDYLKSAESGNLWDNTLVIVSSDNGGTVTEGSSNFPLRGGKKTLWEGGIRSTAFITGGWLPDERRGQDMNALMHVTDWMPTLLTFAGSKSLNEIDGYDQSRNIMNGVVDMYSPREEILHNINYYQELQSDGVSSACYSEFCGAVRWRDYKLIIGSNDQMRMSNSTLCANSWCENAVNEDSISSHSIQCSVDGDNYQFPAISEDDCLYNGEVCLFNVMEDPCEWNDIKDEAIEITNMLYEKMRVYNASQVASLYRGNPEDPGKANPSKFGGYWSPWQNLNALCNVRMNGGIIQDLNGENHVEVERAGSLSLTATMHAVFWFLMVSLTVMVIHRMKWKAKEEYSVISDADCVCYSAQSSTIQWIISEHQNLNIFLDQNTKGTPFVSAQI